MIDDRLLDAVGALAAAHEGAGRIPIIGVAGAQGSGKSTLATAAATRLGGVALSLDDVYLTRAGRAALAASVHPLFATRGPPGTHDLDLLARTLDALQAAGPDDRTSLPVFDKLADERRNESDGPVFEGRPAVIVLEGWCLGAAPQTDQALATPINTLERERDPDGLWRRAVNARLGADYARLFDRLDALLFLKAPSFEVVVDWRCQQEAGLTGAAVTPARRAELATFIQYFERLSRHMLDGGVQADRILTLDTDRRVTDGR